MSQHMSQQAASEGQHSNSHRFWANVAANTFMSWGADQLADGLASLGVPGMEAPLPRTLLENAVQAGLKHVIDPRGKMLEELAISLIGSFARQSAAINSKVDAIQSDQGLPQSASDLQIDHAPSRSLKDRVEAESSGAIPHLVFDPESNYHGDGVHPIPVTPHDGVCHALSPCIKRPSESLSPQHNIGDYAQAVFGGMVVDLIVGAFDIAKHIGSMAWDNDNTYGAVHSLMSHLAHTPVNETWTSMTTGVSNVAHALPHMWREADGVDRTRFCSGQVNLTSLLEEFLQ